MTTPPTQMPADDRVEHPSDEDLAAYLDGGTGLGQRDAIAAHLSECEVCRALVVQSGGAGGAARSGRSRIPLAVATLAMAAAMLTLIVRTPGSEGPLAGDRIVRDGEVGTGEGVRRLAVERPSDEADVPRDSLAFAWEALEEGTVYELSISELTGRVAVRSRVSDARYQLTGSEASRLVDGARYHWRVEALRPDLTSAATDVHTFTVRAR